MGHQRIALRSIEYVERSAMGAMDDGIHLSGGRHAVIKDTNRLAAVITKHVVSSKAHDVGRCDRHFAEILEGIVHVGQKCFIVTTDDFDG